MINEQSPDPWREAQEKAYETVMSNYRSIGTCSEDIAAAYAPLRAKYEQLEREIARLRNTNRNLSRQNVLLMDQIAEDRP